MPVAPVVVCVIAVSAVLMHSVGVVDAVLTVLVGLTVMVKVWGVPLQETPFTEFTGVTVMVELIGAVPVLVAVKEDILPVPLAARPIAVLELVQVNELE
jgi:hypothetical protein